jgi:DNA-binding MarR family transcriptional regulator
MPDAAPTPEPRRRNKRPGIVATGVHGLNQAFTASPTSVSRPINSAFCAGLSGAIRVASTQRTLTDLMASDPNTTTSTLARMEKSRLITRVPHEHHKRANRVRIQPAGNAPLKAPQGRMELQEIILEVLPAARRTKFLEELETIADSCAATVERTPVKRRAGSATAKRPD